MFYTANDHRNIEAEFTKTCFDTSIDVCKRKCMLSDHASPTTELLEEYELEIEHLIGQSTKLLTQYYMFAVWKEARVHHVSVLHASNYKNTVHLGQWKH